MKAKSISKTGQACQRRKPTSSECKGMLMGKCTIEIMQDDKLHIVNQKQKLMKQASLRFGPFEFGEDMDWETFLDEVAEACEATCEGLEVDETCQLFAGPPLQYRRVCLPQEEADWKPANDNSYHEVSSGLGFTKTSMWSSISQAHANLFLQPGLGN